MHFIHCVFLVLAPLPLRLRSVCRLLVCPYQSLLLSDILYNVRAPYGYNTDRAAFLKKISGVIKGNNLHFEVIFEISYVS